MTPLMFVIVMLICFLFLQVFDTTRKVTYKNLPQWLKELREYRPEIPCLCCANKIDGKDQGPVVQSIISLTTLLRCQLG